MCSHAAQSGVTAGCKVQTHTQPALSSVEKAPKKKAEITDRLLSLFESLDRRLQLLCPSDAMPRGIHFAFFIHHTRTGPPGISRFCCFLFPLQDHTGRRQRGRQPISMRWKPSEKGCFDLLAAHGGWRRCSTASALTTPSIPHRSIESGFASSPCDVSVFR